MPLTWWMLSRTRFGLRLRAVGENPAAVDTAGISVTALRYAACIIAGLLCALGGAFLSTAAGAGYVTGMSAGRGFIALAALIVAKWKPVPAMLTCLLFGLLESGSVRLEGRELPLVGEVPSQFISALPFILTVILLAGFIGKAISAESQRHSLCEGALMPTLNALFDAARKVQANAHAPYSRFKLALPSPLLRALFMRAAMSRMPPILSAIAPRRAPSPPWLVLANARSSTFSLSDRARHYAFLAGPADSASANSPGRAPVSICGTPMPAAARASAWRSCCHAPSARTILACNRGRDDGPWLPI